MVATRQAVAARSKHDITVRHLRGESLICRARNTLFAIWYAGNADYLYFWDDDIHTDNVGGINGNLLDMLVASGKPLVGGLYSTRGLGAHCSARAPEGFAPTASPCEVVYLAGGSMLISRECADAMVAAYGELRYKPLRDSDAAGSVGYALFLPMILDSGEYVSEDYAFCERWRRIGGKCYANLDVKLWHWGDCPFGLQDPRKGVRQ